MSRIDTVKTEVFTFAELSDDGKENAIQHFREENAEDFPFQDDNNASLKAFCDILGITNTEYSYGGNQDYINFTMPTFEYYNDNEILESTGIRLQKYLYNNYYDLLVKGKYYSTPGYFDENKKYHYQYRCSKISMQWDNCPLTGYCMDHGLIEPLMLFLESLPDHHTNIEDVFKNCLESWLSACTAGYESTLTDEYITDQIESNGYEFTANGKLY